MKRTLLLFVSFIFIQSNCAQQRVKVQAIEVDTSFDAVSRAKLQQAVKVLDSILNCEAFAREVLSTNFKIGNHGLTSSQILELIRSGADNYKDKPKDYSIDIRVAVFDPYAGYGNFGTTNMTTRITATHRCFILNSEIQCYISHLAHEYMHQIGFYDEKTWALGTKTESVPYKIGNIVKALIGGNAPCVAQKQTCTK